jgi:hypothetical protein
METNMFKWKTIRMVLLALCLCGSVQSPASDPKKDEIITKFGEYKPFDGKLSLTVSEKDGKLSLAATHSSKPKNTVTTFLPSKEGAFWLVYPETATKIWFFREPDAVSLEFTEQGSNTSTYTGASVLKEVPRAVIDALPKEVRERLKGK